MTDGHYEVTKILEMNVSPAPARPRATAARRPARRDDDEAKDAWFVGYTPRLSTAVWVGYPMRASRCQAPRAAPTPRRSGTPSCFPPTAASATTSRSHRAVPVLALLRQVLEHREQSGRRLRRRLRTARTPSRPTATGGPSTTRTCTSRPAAGARRAGAACTGRARAAGGRRHGAPTGRGPALAELERSPRSRPRSRTAAAGSCAGRVTTRRWCARPAGRHLDRHGRRGHPLPARDALARRRRLEGARHRALRPRRDGRRAARPTCRWCCRRVRARSSSSARWRSRRRRARPRSRAATWPRPGAVVTVAVTGWANARATWWAARHAPATFVAVTGELGGSEAGRRLLERGEREPAGLVAASPAAAAAAARWPRARRGRGKRDDRPERRLATDARHVAARSGVELRVELSGCPARGVSAEAAAAAATTTSCS